MCKKKHQMHRNRKNNLESSFGIKTPLYANILELDTWSRKLYMPILYISIYLSNYIHQYLYICLSVQNSIWIYQFSFILVIFLSYLIIYSFKNKLYLPISTYLAIHLSIYISSLKLFLWPL